MLIPASQPRLRRISTMPSRKLLGAAAISAALAGGGVAGALLGTPSLSTAQDSSTSTTRDNVAQDQDTGAERPKPVFGAGPGGLDAAAEALGISEDDLHDALED